jgi:glycosyltransferase involved in cell wall biosynthesis
MKILHGMSDIAGQGSYSASGLRAIGSDAVIAVWRRNPFGYPVDRDMKIGTKKWLYPWYGLKMLYFSIPAFFRYDVFHFHFGYSLLPYAMDLFWLCLAGKKTFMEYHGSDIRYTYKRERPVYYPYPELKPLFRRHRIKNNRILKNIGAVITHDEELKQHIPSNRVFITPLRIQIDRFFPSYPDEENKKPVIVHAPSNYIEKGSEYVIRAVNELKKKYDFEFVLVQNKKQDEAIRLYQEADIIVDQLFAQTYGVFALEAMALGKPVVAYISDEIRKTFPEELPIVSATIDSLTGVLETLITDGKKRRELGMAGRRYVEDYHDYRKIAQVQMDIYQGKIEPMPTKESFLYTKSKEI